MHSSFAYCDGHRNHSFVTAYTYQKIVMKIRSRHSLLEFILLLLGCGVAPLSLAAPGLCWIEKIESMQDEVRVSLKEEYRFALWGIERLGGAEELVRPAPPSAPFFTLREGDRARLRAGNHDWCEIVGARRDGALGVEITAFNRQVGLPLSQITRFASD